MTKTRVVLAHLLIFVGMWPRKRVEHARCTCVVNLYHRITRITPGGLQ